MTCPFCGIKVDLVGLPFGTTGGAWDATLRCLSANTYAGDIRAPKRDHEVVVEVRYG